MNGWKVVSLLVVLVVASAAAGYLAGVSNPNRNTVTVTTVGTLADCGFAKSCSIANPSGLVLTLTINTTSVKPDGSFTFGILEQNPTPHLVNLTLSNGWPIPNFPSNWVCYNGLPPYGISVFRGFYTIANVSSASHIGLIDVYPACISTYPTPKTFSLNAGQQSSDGNTIYAVDGGSVKMPNQLTPIGVMSLHSSKPATYTIAAGDEWGALVLLHFSVVSSVVTYSASNPSLGIKLTMSLNATTIPTGGAVNYSANVYNTRPSENNVTSKSNWALPDLIETACGPTDSPIAYAVLQGHYDSSNISKAPSINYGAMCTTVMGGVRFYSFLPNSDKAYVNCDPSYPCSPRLMSTWRVFSGYPSGMGAEVNLKKFTAGAYTIVAEDEWGDVAMAWFVVS